MNGEHVDLYVNIHKGMRNLLGRFAFRAGATDWSDAASVSALQEGWQEVVWLLHGHHDHEEQHIHPLLARNTPGGQRSFEADHRAQGVALSDLDAHLRRLVMGQVPVEHRADIGNEFYRGFNQFAAEYLPHLHREETIANRSLQEISGPAEMGATLQAIIASIPPDELMHIIDYMFPALSFPEAAKLLGMMRGAPPQAFQAISARIRQARGDADWNRMAATLNL